LGTKTLALLVLGIMLIFAIVFIFLLIFLYSPETNKGYGNYQKTMNENFKAVPESVLDKYYD
jgi:hypothetical protein